MFVERQKDETLTTWSSRSTTQGVRLLSTFGLRIRSVPDYCSAAFSFRVETEELKIGGVPIAVARLKKVDFPSGMPDLCNGREPIFIQEGIERVTEEAKETEQVVLELVRNYGCHTWKDRAFWVAQARRDYPHLFG